MLLMSLLANGDSLSGYQIAAILAEPVSLMWPVKHSQIYPALSALEERGEIVGDWIVQNGRPNKRAYAISPSGLDRLREWLLTPRELLSPDEIRLIVYNLDLLGHAVVATALSLYREQCEDEKRQLDERWLAAWNSPWRDHADDERMMGIRSLYEHALSLRDAQIRWCDTVLSTAKAAVERARSLRQD
jgi:PadR family transcriptional regulator, regulatory protein AphA